MIASRNFDVREACVLHCCRLSGYLDGVVFNPILQVACNLTIGALNAGLVSRSPVKGV